MWCRAVQLARIVGVSGAERCFSRVAHRRPARVIIPDPENPLKTETIIDFDHKGRPREESPREPKAKAKTGLKSKPKLDLRPDLRPDSSGEPALPKSSAKSMNRHLNTSMVTGSQTDAVFDENGQFVYTKLNDNNTNISNLLIMLKSKKERASCGLVLVEGWRSIADGLKSGCTLKTVVFSRVEDLENIKPFLPSHGTRLFKMPYREIQLWSELETSPGIMGVFKTPDFEKPQLSAETLPINIICDNIREPGNLGAILRMADGVGCRKVFLTTGCVDVWESKVVRSAAGAHFRLCMKNNLTWNDINKVVPENSNIFIADNKLTTDTVPDVSLVPKLETAFTYSDRMKCYEAQDSEENSKKNINMPTVPYYEVDFGNLESIYLVIGGESLGISEDCYRFGYERQSLRINIPLKDGVDSLNTGMAVAVVVFEIKRQLIKAACSHIQNDAMQVEV